MINIKILIKALETLPDECTCCAYEGEIIGLVIMDKNGEELGYIETENDGGKLIKN